MKLEEWGLHLLLPSNTLGNYVANDMHEINVTVLLEMTGRLLIKGSVQNCDIYNRVELKIVIVLFCLHFV